MQELRANTQVIVTVGPFVDVGDGFTPQTDIALAGNEAELIKHGSTSVVDISGATWAAVTNCRGYYSLTLTTSHTDTEGLLVVIVQDDSDCLPVKQEYMVLSEAAYDSKYVAKDAGFMDVNVKTIGRADTQETEANNLESACSNYSATRGLAGTSLPAAAADAAGGVPVSDAGGLDMDTKLANTNEVTAARMETLTDWIDGGRLDLLLDAIPTTAMRGTDNAALASVLGALADAAADGDPTSADTVMKYVKQIVNTLVGTAGIPAFPAEAGPANDVSLAEVIRAIHADVTGLNGSAMRGTDSAALASVVGALADAAAAGDPTSADTLMQYAKQLVNVLVGTAGVPAFPAEAAPANDVSLAEVIRAIHADVTGLNGSAMRGTDSAALASLWTAARAGALTDWINGGRLDLILDAILAMLDNARAEPGQGAPPVNADAMTKLDYLFKAWRNKSDQSASTLQLYADDGSTVDQKATVSEAAGTVTKGEVGTGP